jgi:transcriptional regulator with XRE-family HTH domain
MGPGALVEEARRAAGLSQRELAARSGVAQPAIARLERGRVSVRFETLDRLLRACGKAVDVVDRPGRAVDRTLIAERLRLSPRERLLAAAREWERTRAFARRRGRP